MAFGQNTGAKYTGNDGEVKLIEYVNGSETPVAISHVAGFTLTESVVDIETNELGAAAQDGLVGQYVYEGDVDIYKGKAGHPLRAGSYQCAFRYEDGATDGTITGKFDFLSVGLEKKVNGATVQRCRVKSRGTITVVTAV